MTRGLPTLIAGLLTLSLARAAVGAQDDAADTAAVPPTLEPAADLPPIPRTGGSDWLQFKNGEWLKGELKDIQDDRVVFDSDELDTFTLDLDDIHAIYAPRTTTVMLEDRTLVEGRLSIEGDRILVATPDDGDRELTRDEVRSVIPGLPTELNFWSGRFGLGATVRRGNVDQTDLSATVNIQRRTPLTRLDLSYSGAYSLLEGERTENTHRASGTFDVYLTNRLFIRPIQIVYFRDEFQNIDYRLTPSAGFGYDVIDRSRLTWTVGGGAGWEFERFIEAPPGGEIETDSSALLAFTRLEWEATSKVDVGFDFDLTVPIDNLDGYNFRAVAYTEVDLWDDFDLEVRLIWDRNNDPNPNSDGSVPEPDDVRLYVGIAYEF